MEHVDDEFMAILGHELRAPLHALAASTAILLLSDLSEPQSRAVSRIASCADRMHRLIRDLVDATRGQIGRSLPIAPRPTDLSLICKSVLDEIRAAWPGRLVVFGVWGASEGVWDFDRIAQVVSNLVGNALAYSGAETAVRMTVRDQGKSVLLDVHDDGSVIPPAELAGIFDAFQRGSASSRSRNGDGLGLGLYIVRLIVHAHGGEIAVRSTREEGTTFSVRLPKAANEARMSVAGPGKGTGQREVRGNVEDGDDERQRRREMERRRFERQPPDRIAKGEVEVRCAPDEAGRDEQRSRDGDLQPEAAAVVADAP